MKNLKFQFVFLLSFKGFQALKNAYSPADETTEIDTTYRVTADKETLHWGDRRR